MVRWKRSKTRSFCLRSFTHSRKAPTALSAAPPAPQPTPEPLPLLLSVNQSECKPKKDKRIVMIEADKMSSTAGSGFWHLGRRNEAPFCA